MIANLFSVETLGLPALSTAFHEFRQTRRST